MLNVKNSNRKKCEIYSVNEKKTKMGSFTSFWYLYWTPGLGQKGPSVLPSVRKFLRIGSLVFTETQHGVRGPYRVMCDRAGLFGKNPHWAKMVKNGQKWPKNRVFGLFKKIMSLVLSLVLTPPPPPRKNYLQKVQPY